MTARLRRALRFAIERWILRGVLHQLGFVAALIVGVAALGGVVAWAATDRFEDVGGAVWWSFLRLTDPGYLGDDEGHVLRAVSTTVTVLGYVLFMGSLIAILTQWLARTMRNLERGLTPISLRDHVVVLGWTNRTPEIVAKLLGAAGRLERFLERIDARALRLVVLADEVDAERRLALREHVGETWHEGSLFLRSGDSLKVEHLHRLSIETASVVIVPGADFELGGAELSDTRVVKTLLSLDQLLRDVPRDERPTVVAELFDPEKDAIARGAFDGRLEVIASDGVIGRLVSQGVRHPRTAEVLFGLLSHHEGASIYLRDFPELAGAHPSALDESFERAVVLGALRREPEGARAHLNPPPDFRLAEGDALILLADAFAEAVPTDGASREVEPLGTPAPRGRRRERATRILILGWSYKIAATIAELASCETERFEVTIVSRMPIEERERRVQSISAETPSVKVEQVQADYTSVAGLTRLRAERFDSVVFLASDWMHSVEESDARTVLGYVLLKSLLRGGPVAPRVLVELLDPANADLLPLSDDAVFVSPRILSHLLAHVALRPELSAVYSELLISGGEEVRIRAAADLRLPEGDASFLEIQRAARARGEIALGVARGVARDLPGAPRELRLNPPQAERFSLDPTLEIVVLSSTR